MRVGGPFLNRNLRLIFSMRGTVYRRPNTCGRDSMMTDRDETLELQLPPLLIVDYQPVPDVRTALMLLGEDPDDPDFGIPGAGIHPGHVYTISAVSWLLQQEAADDDTDNPTYEQIGVGAAIGGLTAAKDDALRALDDFDTVLIEHRLRGSAEAFAASTVTS
jgi:hypothetical protein